MLELTLLEQKNLKETLVKFGCIDDESIADELIRSTKREEAQRLYHNAKEFLENISVYKRIAQAIKEEEDENNEEEYEYNHCALMAVEKYDKAMSILSRLEEYEMEVTIIREYYEKKRPAKEVYKKLNMGKTCFFKKTKHAQDLFRLVLFGAHTRDIELALNMLNEREVVSLQ